MSRTDKDKPWFARAEWYAPSHDHRCPNRPVNARHVHRDHVCNLPDVPIRHAPTYSSYRRKEPNCTWEPVWPRSHRYWYERPPSRRERHCDWWDPYRAKERDAMIKARKEYRGSGDVEEPKVWGNHRHGSIKGWWD